MKETGLFGQAVSSKVSLPYCRRRCKLTDVGIKRIELEWIGTGAGTGAGSGAGLEESAEFDEQSKIDTYNSSAFICVSESDGAHVGLLAC